MNTKQTPEQAARKALQDYDLQTIIKAFQDRERLLAALEPILSWDDSDIPLYMLDNARDAIAKAKS